MSWRHKQSLEDVLAEEMGPNPAPAVSPSEGAAAEQQKQVMDFGSQDIRGA